MDIEIDEKTDRTSNLTGEKDKNQSSECSWKLVLIIIAGNLILIAICIIIIHFCSKTKIDKITDFMHNCLINATKSAITEKRIKHLVQNPEEDKYKIIVELQKEIFNASFQHLKQTNNSAIKDLDKLISDFLFSGETVYDNISSDLLTILAKKQNDEDFPMYKIYQLLDNSGPKALNQNLNDGKKLDEQKIKSVILYGLINYPMQILFFSDNDDIKDIYIEAIKKSLDPKKIVKTIKTSMEEYDPSSYDLYMVLGGDQDEMKERIEAKSPDIPYINLIDTGLRVQSTKNEAKNHLKENIEKYYTNSNYSSFIKDCFADNITDAQYNNFTIECEKYILDNYTYENETQINEINEFFNYYNFSVETANAFIVYLELGYQLDKIHIIRLGSKYRTQLTDDEMKYDKDNVYILYNVFDKDKTAEGIMRATTESNAKALSYLKDEKPNFLTDEQYNKIILVSSQGNGERQLEAFNIISNLYNYTFKFDAVIWNKNYSSELTDNKTCEYFLESVAKNYHLYGTSYSKIESNFKEFEKDFRNLIKKLNENIDKYRKKL